jgi:hypothetical protein
MAEPVRVTQGLAAAAAAVLRISAQTLPPRIIAEPL